jgi:hypothetical protein
MAGELLHRITAGKISPTSHRVIVPTHNVDCDHELAARISCPMELLLDPLYSIDCQRLFPTEKIDENYLVVEKSQDYISNTSQKLISVNK